MTDRSHSNEIEGFITDPQATIKLSSPSNYKESVSSSKLPVSKTIDSEIRKKEASIEMAVVHAQCRSLDEVFELYGSVEAQNEQLGVEVQQLNENI